VLENNKAGNHKPKAQPKPNQEVLVMDRQLGPVE
jgi:hypothetical protein